MKLDAGRRVELHGDEETRSDRSDEGPLAVAVANGLASAERGREKLDPPVGSHHRHAHMAILRPRGGNPGRSRRERKASDRLSPSCTVDRSHFDLLLGENHRGRPLGKRGRSRGVHRAHQYVAISRGGSVGEEPMDDKASVFARQGDNALSILGDPEDLDRGHSVAGREFRRRGEPVVLNRSEHEIGAGPIREPSVLVGPSEYEGIFVATPVHRDRNVAEGGITAIVELSRQDLGPTVDQTFGDQPIPVGGPSHVQGVVAISRPENPRFGNGGGGAVEFEHSKLASVHVEQGKAILPSNESAKARTRIHRDLEDSGIFARFARCGEALILDASSKKRR